MNWDIPDDTREIYDRFVRELDANIPASFEATESAVLRVLFETNLPIQIEDLWLRAKIPADFLARCFQERGFPPCDQVHADDRTDTEEEADWVPSLKRWTALSVEQQLERWSELSEEQLGDEWQRLPAEARSDVVKVALNKCRGRLRWFVDFQRRKESDFEPLPQGMNRFIFQLDVGALPEGAWQADRGWHIESYTGSIQRNADLA